MLDQAWIEIKRVTQEVWDEVVEKFNALSLSAKMGLAIAAILVIPAFGTASCLGGMLLTWILGVIF
ncbi:hypothetical protein ACFL0C_00160 [Patescibacteria group bacterium]